MSIQSYYTVYFLHVDPLDVRLNLEDEGATQQKNLDIHYEVFQFEQYPSQMPHQESKTHKYRNFIQTLTALHSSAKERTDEIEIRMEERNETCQVEIRNTQSNRTLSSLQFPKQDWANLEEHLLTHGLRLVQIYECKKTVFELARLRAQYELTIHPHIEPYIRISSPYKAVMPEVVAAAGFCISDAVETSEEEILDAYGNDLRYSVFD